MAEAMHVINGGHFGDMYRDLELLLLQDGNLFGLASRCFAGTWVFLDIIDIM